MNKKKLIIIIICILLVGVIVFYLYKKKKTSTENSSVSDNLNESVGVSGPANDSFPLQKGSKGTNVKFLQSAINKIEPRVGLVVDGDFGSKTFYTLTTFIGAGYYPVTEEIYKDILTKAQYIN